MYPKRIGNPRKVNVKLAQEQLGFKNINDIIISFYQSLKDEIFAVKVFKIPSYSLLKR